MGVMEEVYTKPVSSLDGVLQETFGYPPDNLEERTNLMIKKSMPVVSFFPSVPNFQKGLDLFTLRPAWKEYSDLLGENGFTSPNTGATGIKCAYLADNFPTDSFTNEYGENFLQKFTDVASEGAASIAQIMGASSASDAYKSITKNLEAAEGAGGKAVGKGMGYLGNLAGSLKSAITQIPAIGPTAGRSITLIDRLMAGSRIDFPMVWKSSGFQPSYSFTIRLYNPFPQDDQATNTYITGPIVAIMLMGVPRAQDSSTFTWPFLHRISCPGLFELDPGFISNITVVKGGDQQQISLNQRLGIVDIRVDVGSLYSSILGGSSKVTANRPTVLKYAKSLGGKKKITSREEDNLRITQTSGDTVIEASILGERRPKKVSPKIQAKAEEADETPNDRVSQEDKDLYEELISGIPI